MHAAIPLEMVDLRHKSRKPLIPPATGSNPPSLWSSSGIIFPEIFISGRICLDCLQLLAFPFSAGSVLPTLCLYSKIFLLEQLSEN